MLDEINDFEENVNKEQSQSCQILKNQSKNEEKNFNMKKTSVKRPIDETNSLRRSNSLNIL